MSKSRWLCCCSSSTKEPETSQNPKGLTDDTYYLLPGGEWDPSLSIRPKGQSTRAFTSSRGLSVLAGRNSQYKPPPLVQTPPVPQYEDFKLLKTVGRGAFGKVLLCVHQETRILYAMKVVPKAKIATQKQIDQILAECNILKQVRHPFCVSLQYAFQTPDYLFYVCEFAAGGMLFHHLRQAGRFPEPRARFYFGEIILAIDYLHSFGIIFRDLKPENCMLSEQGHIILTDFGSAKVLEASQKTSTIAGTPQYIAPEVLRGEPYSFSADWWSCGILLYEMITGRIPFHSPDRVELYKLVLRGDFVVPRGVSPRAKSLLYRLINRDPDFRLGCGSTEGPTRPVAEIKEHPFFSCTPLDPDEESQYSIEETERERHREAYQKQRKTSARSNSFMGTAETVIKTFSDQTKRLSFRGVYMGSPCEWTWEKLEAREVPPPFNPKLVSPTDLRHFDPTLTSLPPTITDLITTSRDLHLEGFDYVAPLSEDLKAFLLSGESPALENGLGEIPEVASDSDDSGESPSMRTKLVSVEVINS